MNKRKFICEICGKENNIRRLYNGVEVSTSNSVRKEFEKDEHYAIVANHIWEEFKVHEYAAFEDEFGIQVVNALQVLYNESNLKVGAKEKRQFVYEDFSIGGPWAHKIFKIALDKNKKEICIWRLQ